MFTVYSDSSLNTVEIFSSLFKKAPPKPNLSTQNPPLSSTNFLYDLDRITKEITDKIIEVKNSSNLSDSEKFGINVSDVSVQQIMSLRRQYITYSKMHTPDVENIPDLFIQYLRTSLK